MYSEEDLVPLSALQHLIFCERQCALIHLEGVWDENRLTVEGKIAHDRPHRSGTETRPGIRIARGLAIRSLRLGVSGKPDIVEFHQMDAGQNATTPDSLNGILLAGIHGLWTPFPVEYKRGRPKSHQADIIQLCAQAICLEEMLGSAVPSGALFYGQIRRRYDVVFSLSLREETEAAAKKLHRLIASGVTPPAQYSPKCNQCSLSTLCLPKIGQAKSRIEAYLEEGLAILEEPIP